jgi:septal ring factor EnvC (AmiA/AmiB activator)
MAKRRESEAALLALQRDRAEIDRLLAERRGEVDAHDSAIGAERERLAALAAKADDLRALVERIMAPGGDGAAEGPMRVAASGAAPAARGVSEARGRMRLPVAGERVRAFGDRSEAGAVLQGIVMAARPDAEVVAPYDGRIAFADVYGPLGKVLILALGGGYYFVLSGFEEIHGAPGEWVLAGEPVGRLGRARDGGTAAELYVELQKDGKPVDPWVWFVGAGEGIGR